MLIIDFFSRPRWGEMLIETIIKNGPRAPEEVYPAVLRGEIKYNLLLETARKMVLFSLFSYADLYAEKTPLIYFF
jgi:hypothetical protein